MREIKFRAWSQEYKEYYQIWLESLSGGLIGPRDEHYSDLIIEQFTGRKDRNSREIYEEDILFCLSENYKGSVWFENGSFITNAVGLGKTSLFDVDIDDVEVIGNIHENPDLIK